MAKNRMTFEKHQRDAKKKRKAEEKRVLKQKRKDAPDVEPDLDDKISEDDEAIDG